MSEPPESLAEESLAEETLAEPPVPPGASCAVHDDDAVFTCVRCGDFGCADCAFSSIPGREVCATCAKGGLSAPIPWERRDEIGKWRAFWDTTKLTLKSPVRFFKTPPTEASVLPAVVHGVLTVSVGLFITYVVVGALMILAGGGLALLDGDLAPAGAVLGIYGCAFVGLSPVLALLAAPTQALFGQVFAAACAHGILTLGKKTRGTFEDTLRVCSYANAPYALQFIPVLGSFTWFWVVGLEVIGLREAHRCGNDWAGFAAIGWRLAFTSVIVGGYVVLVVAAVATLPSR